MVSSHSFQPSLSRLAHWCCKQCYLIACQTEYFPVSSDSVILLLISLSCSFTSTINRVEIGQVRNIILILPLKIRWIPCIRRKWRANGRWIERHIYYHNLLKKPLVNFPLENSINIMIFSSVRNYLNLKIILIEYFETVNLQWFKKTKNREEKSTTF